MRALVQSLKRSACCKPLLRPGGLREAKCFSTRIRPTQLGLWKPAAFTIMVMKIAPVHLFLCCVFIMGLFWKLVLPFFPFYVHTPERACYVVTLPLSSDERVGIAKSWQQSTETVNSSKRERERGGHFLSLVFDVVVSLSFTFQCRWEELHFVGVVCTVPGPDQAINERSHTSSELTMRVC